MKRTLNLAPAVRDIHKALYDRAWQGWPLMRRVKNVRGEGGAFPRGSGVGRLRPLIAVVGDIWWKRRHRASDPK